MEVSQFLNNYLQRKQEDQFLLQNAILVTCNKLFDALFLPILLYSSEVWDAYDRTDSEKWEKGPIEKNRTYFFTNVFIGLNRSATNIIPRNEAGRLSLKSNISIAKQCLLLSNQLANNGKLSFMLTITQALYGRVVIIPELFSIR